MANSYRMTDRDFRMMIQLRAANAAIFTGKKNSARRGWRAISKEMGLLGQVSPRQLKKKWDYLKEKYMVLKYPPAGMENVSKPSSWRWFHLMDQAMTGKLAGKIITPSQMEEDEDLDGSFQTLSPSNTEDDASSLEVLETGSPQDEGVLSEVSEVKVEESPASLNEEEHVYPGSPDWPATLNLIQSLPPHSDANTMTTSSSSRTMDQNTELDRKQLEVQREPVTRKVIRNPRMSNSYRMTERDFRMMIQLRAANAAIFTGKKNSARRGWRAISKEMGLLGLVSPRQLKKKWDYLQERYKLLKNPPAGMENMSRPSSWRWFHLMDQALSGKLAGTGKILRPSQMDEDEELHVSLQPVSPSNTEEDASGLEVLETGSLQGEDRLMDVTEVRVGDMDVPEGDQVYTRGHDWQPTLNLDPTLPLHSDGDNVAPRSSFSSPRNMDHETIDLDQKLLELQRERMVLDREQAEFDKELIGLEKDRELLNRDMVTVQRERTALDRDRAAVERDRALVERDRAFLERDRAVLEKDRVVLEKEREDLERERTRFRKEREAAAAAVLNGDGSKTVSPKEILLQTRFFESLKAVDLDPDQLETRQRLLSLFQKLVEKL